MKSNVIPSEARNLAPRPEPVEGTSRPLVTLDPDP